MIECLKSCCLCKTVEMRHSFSLAKVLTHVIGCDCGRSTVSIVEQEVVDHWNNNMADDLAAAKECAYWKDYHESR